MLNILYIPQNDRRANLLFRYIYVKGIIIIGTMLICLRMERVYITKWYKTLADPTIIIGGTGRYIVRLRTFFDILEFYAYMGVVTSWHRSFLVDEPINETFK